VTALKAPVGASAAGSLSEERELWRGRMSWKRHLGIGLGWLCVAVGLTWCWWRFHESVETPWLGRIVLLLILGSAGGLFARCAILVYGIRYRLTTQRLFIDRGILSRTRDQTELIRIDDVRIRQSLLDRIVGIGQVELISTDATQAAIQLLGIVEPHIVAEHVRNHTRALRAQRSLFVEQI
jgi:membrane protein YdbS with pleckstrin-like domain